MVLTAAQTTFFWEDNAQGMMLPNATRLALQGEGLTAVDDLSGLTQDLLDNIAASFRRQQIPFGVMSQKRIIDAANCIRYYEVCRRPLTPGNIRWTVIRNFGRQWEALMDKKNRADTHEVPKVSKELTILPGSDAFQDYFCQCIGVRIMWFDPMRPHLLFYQPFKLDNLILRSMD